MKFGVSDLLLATTLVGFYCGAMSFCNQWLSIEQSLFLCVLTTIFTVSFLLRIRHALRNAGKEYLLLKRGYSWWPHLFILSIYLACIGLASWQNQRVSFPHPLIPLVFHAVFSVPWRRLSVFQFGVLIGSTFFTWNDTHFRVEGDHLIWKSNDPNNRKLSTLYQHLHSAGATRIPTDAIESVRETLADMQGKNRSVFTDTFG